MSKFLKIMLFSMCMTTIVSLVLLTLRHVGVRIDMKKEFEKDMSLLTLIANDDSLSNKFKKEFFKAFDKNYTCTYEGQDVNRIIIESILEATKTIDKSASGDTCIPGANMYIESK